MDENPKKITIEHFYKRNRFINILKDTKKYKDFLFCEKESWVSLAISLIITVLVIIVYKTNATKDTFSKDFSEFIRSIISIFISGLFGLLGFLIGGFAILSGTISNKFIKNINDNGKFESLIKILFIFYLDGFIIGITLMILIVEYILTYLNLPIVNILVIGLLTMVTSYFCIFSIIYSIMLLGTTLRFIILGYRYDDLKLNDLYRSNKKNIRIKKKMNRSLY